ncbi:MAG: hypothetical protein R3F61_37935 [Myxococcota bacterium]
MLRHLPLILALGCAAEPPATPAPVDPNAPPSEGVPRDCTAVEHRGAVYDCDELDRCDQSLEALPYRDACCACDPRLCEADPECPQALPG